MAKKHFFCHFFFGEMCTRKYALKKTLVRNSLETSNSSLDAGLRSCLRLVHFYIVSEGRGTEIKVIDFRCRYPLFQCHCPIFLSVINRLSHGNSRDGKFPGKWQFSGYLLSREICLRDSRIPGNSVIKHLPKKHPDLCLFCSQVNFNLYMWGGGA